MNLKKHKKQLIVITVIIIVVAFITKFEYDKNIYNQKITRYCDMTLDLNALRASTPFSDNKNLTLCWNGKFNEDWLAENIKVYNNYVEKWQLQDKSIEKVSMKELENDMINIYNNKPMNDAQFQKYINYLDEHLSDTIFRGQ